MNVLVVEDERKTAAYLRTGLEENGFVVDVAHTGDDALHVALTGAHDCILLDVMLPHMDGRCVLARLRAAGRPTPVLFLTACDDLSDRVSGLELGADDYLVKPFAFSELLARIRSVMRRAHTRRSDCLRVADLEVDPVRHYAARGGKRLDLTAKEFLLLSLFVRHTGEMLSRAAIIEHVWDMNFDPGTNVVDVHVRRLRAKVDDPFPRKLIRTVRGGGYVLE
jgi:two-component system copper resistance phosphate regulon response regulator CusR